MKSCDKRSPPVTRKTTNATSSSPCKMRAAFLIEKWSSVFLSLAFFLFSAFYTATFYGTQTFDYSQNFELKKIDITN